MKRIFRITTDYGDRMVCEGIKQAEKFIKYLLNHGVLKDEIHVQDITS